MRRHPRRRSAERGSVLVLSAFGLTVLLSLVGLVYSLGFAYDMRNQAHAAADAAARAGAWEVLRQGDALSDSALGAFGTRAAQYQGDGTAWLPSPAVTMRRCNSPSATCASAYASKSYVEAVVSVTTSTVFGPFLPSSTLAPTARAVAGFTSSPDCIIVLAPPGSTPKALTVGNATLNLPGCVVADAGDLVGTNPNSAITAASIGISATSCTGTCGNMTNLSTSQPPPVDPLAGRMPPLPSLSGCAAAPSSGSFGGNDQCYSSLTVGNNSAVTLGVGTTYFTGPIAFGNSGTISATSGSTIVLAAGASLTTGNSSTIRVTAPTSGSYRGVAIYQVAGNSNPMSFVNSLNLNITGALYVPGADISVNNGFSSSTDCVILVAKSLSFNNGNGTFSKTCTAFSASPLSTISLAE